MSLPKVSIVIPTYRVNSKPYLDLCIKAVENLNYPKDKVEVIISSHANYIPEYRIARNVLHPNPERSFAEAVNFGITNSDQSSKHVLLLSDDTIPTKDSLMNMVLSVGNNDILAQGISNCDNHWLYNLAIFVKAENETMIISNRFYSLEDFGDNVKHFKNAASLYPPGFLFPPTLCMYAALIPRSVIAKVGLLDEQFRDGYEDSDYVERCRLKGIRAAICLNSLIFHFGGKTTGDTATPEITEQNKKLFQAKWANPNPA